MTFIDPSSKTFWAGVSLIGYGIFELVSGDPNEGVGKILEGLGFIFLRQAVGQAANKAVSDDKAADKAAAKRLAGVVLVMGLVGLFCGPTKAQTATPTDTAVPATATNTPVPATATITPTITQTPDPDAKNKASFVTALELAILKGSYDLPSYSSLCVNSSYDPPSSNVSSACRCVLYTRRVSGTISLRIRCPDGSDKQIVTIP